MKTPILIGIATALVAIHTLAAETQQRFGFAAPLEFTPGDALYVVRLPESVYRHVAHQDLADVRVFNGAGEEVPYAIRRIESTNAQEKRLSALPLFPLGATAQANNAGMDVEVRNDGTLVRIRKQDNKSAESSTTKPQAYLLDASKIEVNVKALVVEFDANAANVVTRVAVESTDDLKRWQSVASDAPLLKTEFNGQRLEQLRIEFASTRAKYFRVSFASGETVHEIRSILPITSGSVVEPERLTMKLTGTLDKEPGTFVFEQGALLPVDKITVRLTENNSVARYDLEGRADEKSPWQTVTHGVAFRMSQNGKTLVSPSFAIYPTNARSYRLKIAPASGVAPELEVAWIPHELVFAARGNEPFTLVYGKAGAKNAALAMESLVPGYGTEAALKPKLAKLGNEQTLSGASALKAPPAYGRYGLWAVLVLGAGILGFMGMRLAKEAGEKQTSA